MSDLYDYTYHGYDGSLSAALDLYERNHGRRPDVIRCNALAAAGIGPTVDGIPVMVDTGAGWGYQLGVRIAPREA